MNPFWLAIAGFFSGITASMGLGGGFVLLIYLSLFTALPQRESQLMNLVFFLPIALLSVFLHAKHHLIEKRVLLKAISMGILGVLIGSVLSAYLDERLLSKLFGTLLIFVGVRELFAKKKTKEREQEKGHAPTS